METVVFWRMTALVLALLNLVFLYCLRKQKRELAVAGDDHLTGLPLRAKFLAAAEVVFSAIRSKKFGVSHHRRRGDTSPNGGFLTPEDLLFLKEQLMPVLQEKLLRYNFHAAWRTLQEIFAGRADQGIYGKLPDRCYSCATSLYVSGREGLIYPCGHMADLAERHPDQAVILGRVGEPLDLSVVHKLPLPQCEVICGPVLKGHNRRAQKAVELMRAMPDLAQVLELESYEPVLINRLHESYVTLRDTGKRPFRA